MSYDYKTSLPAYKENKEGKDRCRQVIFTAIRKLGECTDKSLSEHLGWPINRVTPRRGELVTAGLVESAGLRTDPKTNRKVNYWKVVEVKVKQELQQWFSDYQDGKFDDPISKSFVQKSLF